MLFKKKIKRIDNFRSGDRFQLQDSNQTLIFKAKCQPLWTFYEHSSTLNQSQHFSNLFHILQQSCSNDQRSSVPPKSRNWLYHVTVGSKFSMKSDFTFVSIVSTSSLALPAAILAAACWNKFSPMAENLDVPLSFFEAASKYVNVGLERQTTEKKVFLRDLPLAARKFVCSSREFQTKQIKNT